MKHKVDKYTRKIVSRCTNMAEIWDALDREYGQEQEVVNAVNLELKTLRSENCSTPEYIIKLCHFLPGLESALESVNGTSKHQTKLVISSKSLTNEHFMIGSTLRASQKVKHTNDFSISSLIDMRHASLLLLV